MKILALSCLIFIGINNSMLFGQDQLRLGPNVGLFILNSDNFKSVTNSNNFIFYYGFDASYTKENWFNKTIQLDYSFLYSKIIAPKNEVRDQIGIITGDANVDLEQQFNTIDIFTMKRWKSNFHFGYGPSFSIVSRSVLFDYLDFRDRLMSLNVGLSGIGFYEQLIDSKSPNHKAYIGFKLRYLYGLLYDKRGRDLSDYDQHFLQLSLIVGYSFIF